MLYKVVFAPEAQAQMAELYDYIAAAASPSIAEHYIDAIITYCESLKLFPMRGTVRHDIRPGLRITNYKNRTAIAFTAEADRVSILGIFHGGQDYEAILRIDLDAL